MSRALVKRVAEAVLGGELAAPLIRLRGRSLVLGYHNVVAGEAEAGADASLHVTVDRFVTHLDALLVTHRLVPLDELLERPGGGPPRAALTFDDAYRGVLLHALPELERRGLPATLFVVPGHLDRAFWWDRVRGPEAAIRSFRDHVLGPLRGDGRRALAAAVDRGLEVVEPPAASRPASERELRAAAERPGVTLGSHSWSHRNLAALEPEELEAELWKPLEWLASRFRGARLSRWLAYPYGLFDASVERALTAAGYRGGLRIEGGCLPRRVRPGSVSAARVNVPSGLSARGLRVRAAGLTAG